MKIELELTDQQVQQLRQVMDWLPLKRYAPLICAVNKALPLESDAATNASDADRRTHNPRESAGGFCYLAFTDKGKAGLAHLAKVLDKLEVER